MADTETTKTYGTKITTQGSALIAACIVNGTKLPISKAAAGDGNGAYYEPTVDQTTLKRELWRGDIASAAVNATTSNMIDVKIVIGDSVGNFTVREMALFDDDGNMIAVCNTPDTEKVDISAGVSGKLTMLMHIIVADASVLEFTITPSLDTVTADDLAAAIAEHNASSTCHADIRELALNSLQQGDAYTKAESDALLASGISTHNSNTEAHPSILSTISGLDGRLKTLELKYGTNVTGQSFEVTFASLTGLVVTGVWNKTYARLEF